MRHGALVHQIAAKVSLSHHTGDLTRFRTIRPVANPDDFQLSKPVGQENVGMTKRADSAGLMEGGDAALGVIFK
jgi:hypothetical protein